GSVPVLHERYDQRSQRRLDQVVEKLDGAGAESRPSVEAEIHRLNIRRRIDQVKKSKYPFEAFRQALPYRLFQQRQDFGRRSVDILRTMRPDGTMNRIQRLVSFILFANEGRNT